MRSEARVVVIGGGVAGCSALYHLTKLGWDNVVLVEENELTSGSTWHAAGLCTQMISSWNLMKLLRYSLELYNRLEAETGQAVVHGNTHTEPGGNQMSPDGVRIPTVAKVCEL